MEKKIKKIKNLLRKNKALFLLTQIKQEKIDDPEKEIRESCLLNKENLDKLLIFLRNIYPIGYSYEGIKNKIKIDILLEKQLDDLVKEGIIAKRELDEFSKKHLNPNFTKFYPEYVITNKGMNFVSSIESHKLNKSIERLTKILIGFGVVTIFLMIVQIIVQFL